MKLLKTIAAMGVALSLVGPSVAAERVSIGTGGTGGLFYVIGAGMAELLNQNMPDTTARAEVTGASVENIRRVAAGQMTFGFSSSSTLYEATVAEGRSKKRSMLPRWRISTPPSSRSRRSRARASRPCPTLPESASISGLPDRTRPSSSSV